MRLVHASFVAFLKATAEHVPCVGSLRTLQLKLHLPHSFGAAAWLNIGQAAACFSGLLMTHVGSVHAIRVAFTNRDCCFNK